MFLRTCFNVALIINIILITACGGGTGEGLDENGRPISSTQQPLVATLTSIQENVFSVNCALPGCHIPAIAPFGLVLSSTELSAQTLLNTDSFERPTVKRIEPFDPGNSYIIQKIEGKSGNRMPLGRPALSPEVIAVIRQWISEGALNN